MVRSWSAAILSLSMLATNALAAGANSAPATIQVTGGAIRGEVSADGKVQVFKGIPYAAPPVGDLRWRSPQPVVPWQGVKPATSFSAICMQPQPLQGDSLFTKLFFTPIQPQSEDCLYLNVWKPANAGKAKLPVMFWIPGGGFQGGSGADPFYDGVALARQGVVLVTINYRLSKLGFLAHPELTAESANHASGNYGLMDMVAALKWVQANIGKFGGDPKKVTIFGQSAGGYAVSYMVASPLTKGLFQRAIAESGGGFTPARPGSLIGRSLRPLADAEKDGEKLAQSVGAKNLAELRQKPASEIMAALSSDRFASGMPDVDGYVLPDTVEHIFQQHRENHVPVLTGSNSDEGSLFPALHTLKAYQDYAHKDLGSLADTFLALYPAHDDATAWQAFTTSYRERVTAWTNWEWVRVQGQPGHAPIYYYYFTRHPPAPQDEQFAEAPGAKVGAYHGAEIAYVFGSLYPQEWRWSEDDKGFSRTIQRYWIDFAKTGNPNGKGLTKWPVFDPAHPEVMIFDKTNHMGAVPNQRYYNFWDAYVRQWNAK